MLEPEPDRFFIHQTRILEFGKPLHGLHKFLLKHAEGLGRAVGEKMVNRAAKFNEVNHQPNNLTFFHLPIGNH